MENLGKKLGFRKACPHEDCKKMLVKTLEVDGVILGKIKQTMLCPKCFKQVTIIITSKPHVEVYKTIIIYVILFLSAASLFITFSNHQQFASLVETYGFKLPE